MGPVVGEYVANRVLGNSTAADLDESFRVPVEEYPAATG
jgi:hypothetical protein